MSNKGINTDKHYALNIRLNNVESKMVDKLKKHYGFKSNRQLFITLIKHALISIDKKNNQI